VVFDQQMNPQDELEFGGFASDIDRRFASGDVWFLPTLRNVEIWQLPLHQVLPGVEIGAQPWVLVASGLGFYILSYSDNALAGRCGRARRHASRTLYPQLGRSSGRPLNGLNRRRAILSWALSTCCKRSIPAQTKARIMSMPSALHAVERFLNAARRLPAAIAQSFNPATPADANIVDLQLDFIQTSIRRLDWALPLAGAAVMFTVHAYGIALAPVAAWFGVLVCDCLSTNISSPAGPDNRTISSRM